MLKHVQHDGSRIPIGSHRIKHFIVPARHEIRGTRIGMREPRRDHRAIRSGRGKRVPLHPNMTKI
jgi:hypothetical protein